MRKEVRPGEPGPLGTQLWSLELTSWGEGQGCPQRKRGSHLWLAPCSLGHSPDPCLLQAGGTPVPRTLHLGRTRSLSHQEEVLAGPGV